MDTGSDPCPVVDLSVFPPDFRFLQARFGRCYGRECMTRYVYFERHCLSSRLLKCQIASTCIVIVSKLVLEVRLLKGGKHNNNGWVNALKGGWGCPVTDASAHTNSLGRTVSCDMSRLQYSVLEKMPVKGCPS